MSYLIIQVQGGAEGEVLGRCRTIPTDIETEGVVEVLGLVVETLASVGTIPMPERLRGDEEIKLALNGAQ
jgi:hypothetical protein